MIKNEGINLEQAIRYCDIAAVKTAIQSGVDVNAPVGDNFQKIPLLLACDDYYFHFTNLNGESSVR